MAARSNLVNLDALIRREDFAAVETGSSSFDNVATISVRDFTQGGLIGPSLRKPDFQRETNHWVPDQVVSLLECFVNGDLIPSVILWKSPTYLFVIDGGHRLSVLKAWIEDDYGDGHTSQMFFGYQITAEQKKNAEKTRTEVSRRIGSWQQFAARAADENLDPVERQKISTVISRGIPIQWVHGDADKAESSFFKINTKGTPLDEIEELLLRNRKKPISIASRAIIRAGKGHRYWSAFSAEITTEIESLAKSLHSILFDPEIKRPIKTLDLPLGGPKGVRTAIEALIDLTLISTRNQLGLPKSIQDTNDDYSGEGTRSVLYQTLNLAKRITGNDSGSLGLHPAVYFYGPSGRHSSPMFMGTMTLVGQKLANNDKLFFQKFTDVRAKMEDILINHKELLALIIQKNISTKRVQKYADFLNSLINALLQGEAPSEADMVRMAGLEGKILVGQSTLETKSFSEDAKSQAFIKLALKNSMKCPICGGYMDVEKSVSYDHVLRAREGGGGSWENCALTHPFCNQSVKQ